LPELARTLGRQFVELKKAANTFTDTVKEESQEEENNTPEWVKHAKAIDAETPARLGHESERADGVNQEEQEDLALPPGDEQTDIPKPPDELLG
jgi:Sec-independent protein translocase protein TatA